jgi:hypothetical protein
VLLYNIPRFWYVKGVQSNKSGNLNFVESHFMTCAATDNLDRSGDAADLWLRNPKLHMFKICSLVVALPWWG